MDFTSGSGEMVGCGRARRSFFVTAEFRSNTGAD